MTAPTGRVTEHIPAMCRFMLQRMRDEARAASRQPDNPLAAIILADIESRRELIKWVMSWSSKRAGGTWDERGDDDGGRRVRASMERHHEMHGYALRYLLARYAEHPRFRPEWQVSR